MSGVEERLRGLLEDTAPQMAPIPITAIERGASRRRRRRATLAIVGSAGAVVLAAAGIFVAGTTSSAPTRPPVSRPSSTDTQQSAGEYTETAAWLAVGEQIRQARRADPGLQHVINVQLSAPVDVTKPGTYVMEIGPVPARTKPGDFGMTLPPDIGDHFDLQGSPLQGVTFVHRATGVFVQVHLRITLVRAPYHHLTAWFQ